MALRTPEASLGVGIGTAALAYIVFDMSLPPLADVRQVETGNVDIQRAERVATGVSSVLVAGIGLITEDATVFIVGGVMVIALAWMYRHADQVSPLAGRVVPHLSVPGGVTAAPPAEMTETVYVDEQIGA